MCWQWGLPLTSGYLCCCAGGCTSTTLCLVQSSKALKAAAQVALPAVHFPAGGRCRSWLAAARIPCSGVGLAAGGCGSSVRSAPSAGIRRSCFARQVRPQMRLAYDAPAQFCQASACLYCLQSPSATLSEAQGPPCLP